MHAKVLTESLSKALKNIKPLFGKNNDTLMIKFDVSSQCIELIGNRVNEITAYKVTGTIEMDGMYAVSFKTFDKLISTYKVGKKFTQDVLTFSSSDSWHLKIESHSLNLAEMNELPDLTGFESVLTFYDNPGCFPKLFAHAAPEDNRADIHGLYFETTESGQVTIVGADGFRLMESTLTGIETHGKATTFIYPYSKISQAVLKNFEMLEISMNPSRMLRLDNGDQVTYVGAVDAKFPDYRVIFPLKTSTYAMVYCDELKAVLNRCKVFAKDTNYAVQMNFHEADSGPGSVTFFAYSQEHGDIQCLVDSDVKGSFDVAVNLTFLLDTLEGERLTISGNGESAPLVIETEVTANRYLIMPMNGDGIEKYQAQQRKSVEQAKQDWIREATAPQEKLYAVAVSDHPNLHGDGYHVVTENGKFKDMCYSLTPYLGVILLSGDERVPYAERNVYFRQALGLNDGLLHDDPHVNRLMEIYDTLPGEHYRVKSIREKLESLVKYGGGSLNTSLVLWLRSLTPQQFTRLHCELMLYCTSFTLIENYIKDMFSVVNIDVYAVKRIGTLSALDLHFLGEADPPQVEVVQPNSSIPVKVVEDNTSEMIPVHTNKSASRLKRKAVRFLAAAGIVMLLNMGRMKV